MKVTFLTTGSREGVQPNGEASVLIEESGTAILLNCGKGCLYHLGKETSWCVAEVAASCIISIDREATAELIPLILQHRDDLPPLSIVGPPGLAGHMRHQAENLAAGLYSQVCTTFKTEFHADSGTDFGRGPHRVGRFFITPVRMTADDGITLGYYLLAPTGKRLVYAVSPADPVQDIWYLCSKPDLLIIAAGARSEDAALPIKASALIEKLKPAQTCIIGSHPDLVGHEVILARQYLCLDI